MIDLWIRYHCPVLNGGAHSLNKAYFENLRIPLDNAELLQQLATLADEIIAAKKQASCHPERSASEVEGSSEALQKQIANLETQVNTLVYQLYSITDAVEIEAVERR